MTTPIWYLDNWNILFDIINIRHHFLPRLYFAPRRNVDNLTRTRSLNSSTQYLLAANASRVNWNDGPNRVSVSGHFRAAAKTAASDRRGRFLRVVSPDPTSHYRHYVISVCFWMLSFDFQPDLLPSPSPPTACSPSTSDLLSVAQSPPSNTFSIELLLRAPPVNLHYAAAGSS